MSQADRQRRVGCGESFPEDADFSQKKNKLQKTKTQFKITPRGEDRKKTFSFNPLPVSLPIAYSSPFSVQTTPATAG